MCPDVSQQCPRAALVFCLHSVVLIEGPGVVVCVPWEVFLALSECQCHGSPVNPGSFNLHTNKTE